jgi:hypothetical protein
MPGGFCRQHFNAPVADSETNIQRVARWGRDVTTIIAGADGVVKIVEFLIKLHLSMPRASSSGSTFNESERWFQKEFDPYWPEFPKRLVPGARVRDIEAAKKLYKVATDLTRRF